MLPFDVSSDASASGGSPVVLILSLAVSVLIIVATWKVFAKAGSPGWLSIIPILNTLALLKIVKRPLWWFVLLLIPGVNVVILIIVMNDLAKAFGRGIGTTLLLILLSPIALLILGFGKAEYQLAKEPLF